jgi:hypothetical protein
VGPDLNAAAAAVAGVERAPVEPHTLAHPDQRVARAAAVGGGAVPVVADLDVERSPRRAQAHGGVRAAVNDSTSDITVELLP